MDPNHDDELRQTLEAAETHAAGLNVALARLRALISEQPALAPGPADERGRLPGVERQRAVAAAPVEGELADDEPASVILEEGPSREGPIASPPAPERRALPASEPETRATQVAPERLRRRRLWIALGAAAVFALGSFLSSGWLAFAFAILTAVVALGASLSIIRGWRRESRR